MRACRATLRYRPTCMGIALALRRAGAPRRAVRGSLGRAPAGAKCRASAGCGLPRLRSLRAHRAGAPLWVSEQLRGISLLTKTRDERTAARQENELINSFPWQSLACVCVLLQDLLQSCARGGRRRVEDMCYERRRAEACVDESAHHVYAVCGGVCVCFITAGPITKLCAWGVGPVRNPVL